MAQQGRKHGINVFRVSGELKKLGELVNEYSERFAEQEVDLRGIKRLGDDSVHVNVYQNNVISWPKVGFGHAFKSWDALRKLLEWLYG